jgi:hypothetical protein
MAIVAAHYFRIIFRRGLLTPKKCPNQVSVLLLSERPLIRLTPRQQSPSDAFSPMSQRRKDGLSHGFKIINDQDSDYRHDASGHAFAFCGGRTIDLVLAGSLSCDGVNLELAF